MDLKNDKQAAVQQMLKDAEDRRKAHKKKRPKKQ